MKTADAIKILEEHNTWRRGDNSIPMHEPKILGEAIDVIVNQFKQVSIGEEVSIKELAKEIIDKRFTGIPIATLELSAKHTAEHLLDNFNIARKQTQPLSTEVEEYGMSKLEMEISFWNREKSKQPSTPPIKEEKVSTETLLEAAEKAYNACLESIYQDPTADVEISKQAYLNTNYPLTKNTQG